MNEQRTYPAETIRVAVAAVELDLPVCSEVMSAIPDPADPDQAVLVNVPVLVDEINFGDIVRLGDETEGGVRRSSRSPSPAGMSTCWPPPMTGASRT